MEVTVPVAWRENVLVADLNDPKSDVRHVGILHLRVSNEHLAREIVGLV